MSQPALYGHDLFGDPIEAPRRGKLADEFLVPPFSVLNAREGSWQERKRAWLALGIKSELGRGSSSLDATIMNNCAPGQSLLPAANYQNRERGNGRGEAIAGTAAVEDPNSLRPRPGGRVDERPGRPAGTGYEGGDAWLASENNSGASIFDPVLCELVYSWFCPPAGRIIDPFAGGSVRGVVAALMGRHYTGIDLLPGQIEHNRQQAAGICDNITPTWIVGDADDIDTIALPAADCIFSCPPYGDLERYSDDPRDLSTLLHPEFLIKYRRIISKTCACLRENRFACFVVGDYRDRYGNYRNFVGETIAAFLGARLKLYNEAVLVTAVGSLSIRAPAQFRASRKLGKTHQNVLVFVKGDGQSATVNLRGEN